jgi:hypothetical protein
MRSVTVAPPRRFAAPFALAAIACAALAACSFDLELPALPSSPTVTDFSPKSALAGQLVRVTGSHFAAVAGENTVNFANASARAERFDGGVLVVRVPANAGDGPITVANLEGTSRASSAPFDYLGLGEPGRLQVASSTPILQHPRAVLAYPAPEVALDSGLFGGLLFLGNPSFATPTVLLSADASGMGLAYYVYDAAGKVMLDALDVASATKKASIELPGIPKQLLHLAGRNVLLAFGEDGVGAAVVSAYNASTLAQILAPLNYGVEGFWGATDLRDGRVVVAGFDANYVVALFLLDLRTLPALPPAPVQFGCAGSYTGACPPMFNAPGDLVPLAAADDGAGAGTVYVAAPLDDGNAAVASISTGAPTFDTLVDTFSPTLIESIVASSSKPIFVATKPGDDLALAFGGNGALHWFVDAANPTVAASVNLPAIGVLPAVDYAFVAGDGDNGVLVVDMATGQRVSRISFDVQPRAGGYADAAAFVRSATGGDGDVVFPATAFPGLVRLPLGTDPPTAISRTAAIQAVAVAPETATLWAAASAEPVIGSPPAQVEGWVGFSDGAFAQYVRAALAADPQRIAAHGTTVVVGHGAGLSLVDSSVQQAGVADAAAIPGISGPTFLGLGFTPEGKVWTLVTGSSVTDPLISVTEVQLWEPGSIVSGGLPTATRPVLWNNLTAAWLEDGLWIFGSDEAGLRHGQLLSAALGEVRTVGASDRLGEIHAVSPNGRLLVCRESTTALGFPVRFFRADPDAGFPEVGSLVFDARVEALTFDASGERLYVLTQLPDRVVTID